MPGVSILGKDELDNETKEQIGVVFDGSNYPEILSPKKINQIMKNIYGSWDEQAYFRLLKQFSLPLDKQIKQFSKGMKMIRPSRSPHHPLSLWDACAALPASARISSSHSWEASFSGRYRVSSSRR